MDSTSCIKYIDENKGISYNRLLVLPLVRPEVISENGLIIPEDAGKLCEEGEVFDTCKGSDFKRGDKVIYRKVDRLNKDEYTSVIVHGIEYDAISESEVWSVNEKPHNRLFVEPISDISIGENEIIIPDDVKGIPQKGIVVSVGFNAKYKEGDIIEYRKQEQGIFPTVNLDGRTLDVLFESDVYTVNEAAASHRIIIKIDIGEQSIKRNTTASGIALSPLFQFMLRNLQYGEVMDIGADAALRYPELEVGDTAIIHHTVESQPYRLLKTEKGSYDNILYEYRIINITKDALSREIFGKLSHRFLYNKIHDTHIVPFDKNIFLKWEFDVFEPATESNSIHIDMDYSLNGCHDIEDFRRTLEQKKQAAVRLFKIKGSGITNQLGQLDPENEQNKDIIAHLENQMRELQREVFYRSGFINKNHLLTCTTVFPHQINNKVVVPFNELYPINLMGKKYLIAHSDLIQAIYMTNKLVPFGKKVMILPIEDEKEGLIEIPDSAKERPVRGKVVGVGAKIDEDISEGDILYYKRILGTDVKVDGVEYVCLHQNDLLFSVKPLVAEDVAAI